MKISIYLLDPDYERFLEVYNGHDDEKMTSTPETLLEELEAKTKELGGMYLYFVFLKENITQV